MMRNGDLEGRFPRAFRVAQVRQETPRVRTFVLEGRLAAQPGQFVMAWLPGLDEKPFSLADADPLTLAVARVGPFTEALHRLKVGDRLWVRGPQGRGFSVPSGRLFVVGGGYGVAPLLFLARRAREAGREVWAALGARTAAELLFVDRFRALGCRVEVATEDGSTGRRGLAPEVAAALLAEGGVAGLAACGPEGLLQAVAALGRRWDVPTEVSREAYMRCGIGVCGSCARDGRLVCKDGPVFQVHPAPASQADAPLLHLPHLEVTPLAPEG
ncbi:MAG: dihydroorotate dehydrogenase electron transfer subunit [Anaerolineae bacterium]|nr:dihydroorotate dehydrogenase electron transfer subunit [Anaerolineae bacterium]